MASRWKSLYDWCLENGEYGQQLLFEFGEGSNEQIYENEYGMMQAPQDYSYASHTKIKWTCKEYGHTWQSTVRDRTRGHGCPECKKIVLSKIRSTPVIGENDLLSYCLNNANCRHLIDEWIGLDENDNKIEMTDVTKASNKKVKWRCQKSHIFVADICHRTLNGRGCPICSNKIIISGINDLKTFCLKNEEYKHLLDEWMGVDEKGNKIEMDQVAKGTALKVWWRCSKGHEWLQAVANRIQFKTVCQCCNKSGTSYPEQFLYHSLKQIYPNTISRGKYQGYEYDIAIPEERLCIEYSPTYWHKDKLERDIDKLSICEEHDVRFIYIRDDSKDEYEHCFKEDYICYKASNSELKHDTQLAEILDYILKSLGHSIEEINIKQAKIEAFNFMHDK